MKLACLFVGASVFAVAQTRTYQDSQKRFEFTYPAAFGTPSAGTDSGFRDRVAAIRWSEFSSGVRAGRITLGGEAVLTKGSPQVDLQAAGGLYDEITLGVFPESAAAVVRSAIPRLTAANFCDAITRELHADPADPKFRSFTAPLKAAVEQVDRMGNASPKVLRCSFSGETAIFEKQAGTRYIYGAIRFLAPPYSSFQLIRGGTDAPAGGVVQQITALVNSWRELR